MVIVNSTPYLSLLVCSNLLFMPVCKKRFYSIIAMCTGHYPVPSGAVDMTGIEPCKEVESVSECIVIGRMHAV